MVSSQAPVASVRSGILAANSGRTRPPGHPPAPFLAGNAADWSCSLVGRVVVVSKAVESAGGKLEAYYLMFGQYDGFVIVDLPDARAAAATSLAVSSTGAFEHLETHELIEAEDLNPILEQAKGITAQLPGI